MTCDTDSKSRTVAFSHPLFIKAHPEQVQQIKMTPKKDKKAASAAKEMAAKSIQKDGHESDESVTEIPKKREYTVDAHTFLVDAALARGKPYSGPRGSLPDVAATASAVFPQLARQSSGDTLRRRLLTEQQQGHMHRTRPYFSGATSEYDTLRGAALTGSGSLSSSVNSELLRSLTANRRAADEVSEMHGSLLQSMAARQRYRGVLSGPFNSLVGARPDLLSPGSSLLLARERLALQNALLREDLWNRQGLSSDNNMLSRALQNSPTLGGDPSSPTLGGAPSRLTTMKRDTSRPPIAQERKQA